MTTALRDKEHNDQCLLYLGAGAGPFIALVAQVQVEEDIVVLNTSKLRHLFHDHPRKSDIDFCVVVSRALLLRNGRAQVMLVNTEPMITASSGFP